MEDNEHEVPINLQVDQEVNFLDVSDSESDDYLEVVDHQSESEQSADDDIPVDSRIYCPRCVPRRGSQP